MKRQQTCKFQLLPNGEQQRKMRQFAGCCRWVFNEALSRQVEHHENDGKFIPYVKMTHWLVEWKNSAKHRWLGEAPSQVLQQALKNLARAYKNLFADRASFPNKRKRGKHDSFRYPQGIKLEQQNSPIFLPKQGSNNWRKAVRRVQKIHIKVANMSKSAKGSLDVPGRNVRAKSGLNRSILEQGWHELRHQLEYKQFWRGGDIVAVPPHNTSRRYSSCGRIAKERRDGAVRPLDEAGTH